MSDKPFKFESYNPGAPCCEPLPYIPAKLFDQKA